MIHGSAGKTKFPRVACESPAGVGPLTRERYCKLWKNQAYSHDGCPQAYFWLIVEASSFWPICSRALVTCSQEALGVVPSQYWIISTNECFDPSLKNKYNSSICFNWVTGMPSFAPITNHLSCTASRCCIMVRRFGCTEPAKITVVNNRTIIIRVQLEQNSQCLLTIIIFCSNQGFIQVFSMGKHNSRGSGGIASRHWLVYMLRTNLQPLARLKAGRPVSKPAIPF